MKCRTWWMTAVVACAICGCQSTDGWNAWFPQESQGMEPAAGTHTVARTQRPGPFSRTPQEGDSPEWLLQYATDQDNAHRRNPANREALRQARTAYERILENDPANAYVLHRLGTVADREGQYEQAGQYYGAALEVSPNNAELLSDIGYSCLLQGRLPESEQYLRRALEVNPRQPKTRINLGLVYAQMGRETDAYELIRAEKGDAEARELLARAGSRDSVAPGGAPPADPAEPLPEGLSDATRKLAEELAKSRAQRDRLTGNRPSRQQPLSAPSPWEERQRGQATQTQEATPQPGPTRLPPEQWNTALRDIDRAYAEDRTPNRTPWPAGGQANLQQTAMAPAQPGHWRENPITLTGAEVAAPQDGSPVRSARNAPSRPSADWDDARAQAARLGMQAGGGILFSSPPRGALPNGSDPWRRQTGSTDPAGWNGETGNLSGPLPEAPLSPPGDWRQAAETPASDEQAELDLLNDQVRQLQEQIAQKRSELSRARQQPPPPESGTLPPPAGW